MAEARQVDHEEEYCTALPGPEGARAEASGGAHHQESHEISALLTVTLVASLTWTRPACQSCPRGAAFLRC